MSDSDSKRSPINATQLACAYFFKPSDVASLSIDVHSVSVELNGTMFAETPAAAAETTVLTYSLSLCWLRISSPNCNTPVSGGINTAGSTDVTAASLRVSASFPVGGQSEVDLLDPVPALGIRFNFSSRAEGYFVINGIDLQVNATVGKPSTTARIVNYIADKFGLRDYSIMSIVAVVITAFYCGIVCTGVVWSICRRGKKPIAYDKQ